MADASDGWDWREERGRYVLRPPAGAELTGEVSVEPVGSVAEAELARLLGEALQRVYDLDRAAADLRSAGGAVRVELSRQPPRPTSSRPAPLSR